ncbi:very-long-chain 3-oxoacyl-CoA reductase-like [Dermochelys coriacea]|uniref:very-long-chain 3-oxoacyl-CoA reductase-like n=1 Tax=Dermochelys coriacea TaxID=27794 RepID=UPI0018E7CF5E|nr:very-long-chain 3-oxoacyl-CoA reductase-like [Dermochelys coriacea]
MTGERTPYQEEHTDQSELIWRTPGSGSQPTPPAGGGDLVPLTDLPKGAEGGLRVPRIREGASVGCTCRPPRNARIAEKPFEARGCSGGRSDRERPRPGGGLAREPGGRGGRAGRARSLARSRSSRGTMDGGVAGLPALGALVGLGLLLRVAWALSRAARPHLLAARGRGAELARFGAWAVVTGATSGIGRAYAHELAKRGLNVVLISRSLQKLKQVAAEIEEQHGQSTRVIEADFTQGSEIYDSIQTALQGLEIGILVNNVAMTCTKEPVHFLDIPNIEKTLSDIVNCNMLSVAKMTRIVLPQMLTRKKGVIINLSSEVGRHPHPVATVYSATKRFVDFFSRGLEAEYHSQGILVQSVLPLFVSTNMTNNIIPNRYIKTAEDFACEALNTVGISSRTSGCLSHSMQSFFYELLVPEWFLFSSLGFKCTLALWSKLKTRMPSLKHE